MNRSWGGKREAVILNWSRILTPSAVGAQLTARASVIDGDTIDVAGERIRRHGIDAPESRQTCRDAAGATYACGMIATSALVQAIGSQLVSCQPFDRDRYGQRLARCSAGGTDLAGWLV